MALGSLFLGATPRATADVPASAAAAAPAEVIQIDVRGAAALVTVTRSFRGAATTGAAREELLDLALPASARLIDVERGALRG